MNRYSEHLSRDCNNLKDASCANLQEIHIDLSMIRSNTLQDKINYEQLMYQIKPKLFDKYSFKGAKISRDNISLIR